MRATKGLATQGHAQQLEFDFGWDGSKHALPAKRRGRIMRNDRRRFVPVIVTDATPAGLADAYARSGAYQQAE